MKRFSIITAMLICVSMVFAITCRDVQYTTSAGADGLYPSPLMGQTVTVTGIVTANTFGTTSTGPDPKFYISDPEGGPWSGLYIFKFGSGVQIGDMVSVTGAVMEYYGLTEIGGNPTVTVLSSGNALPAPALIATNLCPVTVPVPPATVALIEPYEGVLCMYENVTVTAAPDTHQEFYVTDGSGPGQVDDNGYQYPHSWAGVTVGTTWDRLVGIIDYNFNLYGLNPRNDTDMYTVSAQDYVVLPDVKLIGNYPNPFNQNTAISFNLKSAQNVNLSVYNLRGQLVRTLTDGRMSAELHSVDFDGKDNQGNLLAAGVYMYKLTADKSTQTKKLIIR